jgi:hypothetical protein
MVIGFSMRHSTIARTMKGRISDEAFALDLELVRVNLSKQ